MLGLWKGCRRKCSRIRPSAVCPKSFWLKSLRERRGEYRQWAVLPDVVWINSPNPKASEVGVRLVAQNVEPKGDLSNYFVDSMQLRSNYNSPFLICL